MTTKYQCAFGCRKKRVMYRFPKDKTRRLQWFKETNLKFSMQKNMSLCKKHFSKQQFIEKRLKNDAVPDKCLKQADNSDDDESDKTSDDDEIAIGCKKLYDSSVTKMQKLHDPLSEPKTPRSKLLTLPMATLEMKITTEEWQKVEKLELSNNASTDVEPLKQLEVTLKLPKGITIKQTTRTKTALKNDAVLDTGASTKLNVSESNSNPVLNDWHLQVQELTAKVKENHKIVKADKNLAQNDHTYAETEKISSEIIDLDSASSSAESVGKKKISTLACDEILTADDELNSAFNFETNDIEAPTLTSENSKKTQDCGLVQHSSVDNTFKLTCCWCSSVYQLCNWQQYVEHFHKAHHFENTLKLHLEKSDQCSIALSKKTSTFETCYIESASNQLLAAENEDTNGFGYTTATSSDNEDEQLDTGVLDFERTNSERILKFLDTLQSNSLLWHLRRQDPILWDQQAEDFIEAFDAKMSAEDFRKSMDAVHAFYQSFVPATDKSREKFQKNPHFWQYFEKLDKIATLSEAYACTFDDAHLGSHKHTRHGIDNLPYVCSCGLHFKCADQKAAHEKVHNNITATQLICELCGLDFPTKAKLTQHHASKHHALETHKCTQCDAKFRYSSSLRSHCEHKHRPPRFKCEICDKTFKKAENHKSHMKMHLNQRDIICGDCGQGFYSKETMRQHKMRVHQEQQYRCRPCYEHFSTYELLKRHNDKHHPNGENFERVREQRRQARRKKRTEKRLAMGRKEREPTCKQCGAHFEGMRDYLKHKRESGHFFDGRHYKCPHCDSVLSSGSSLLRHLSKIHKLSAKAGDLKNYTPLKEDKGLKVENEEALAQAVSVELLESDMPPNNEISNEMFEEYLSENEMEL